MSVSPHQAAWNEARALLAEAERAMTDRAGPGELGAAVARVDSAITLLERLRDSTTHTAPRRFIAAAWSLRARLRERVGSPEALDDALLSEARAVEQLRDTPGDADLQVRCDLAVALHQQGNLLQQRAAVGDISVAVSAYDEAIAMLTALPVDSAPASRHVLGAIWLNRGAAWVRLDDTMAVTEALRSFEAAISTWIDLPADAPPGSRINLAAAWMNRAHSLLRQSEAVASARAAHNAANQALAILGELEHEHASAGDVGLKARHIICRALGLQLAEEDVPHTELLTLATDVVDEGLALARAWRNRQAQMPLGFVADLFRFGIQTFLSHQPHFLAEFILDNLDPEKSADAFPWHPELHAVAREAVTIALRDLERIQLVHADNPNTARRIETLHDLRHAQARLEILQAAAPRQA